MQEYQTDAFILSSEPIGESDLRVHFFSKELGRVVARVRSARKAHAKLAAHVQPLARVRVRLVERKGMQIVDALTLSSPPKKINAGVRSAQIAASELVIKMTDERQPDLRLFELLWNENIATPAVLRLLGFDPAHARCAQCQKMHPERFVIAHTEYYCLRCLAQLFHSETRDGSLFVVS